MGQCCGSKTGNPGEDFIFNILSTLKVQKMNFVDLKNLLNKTFASEADNMTLNSALDFSKNLFEQNKKENPYYEYHNKIVNSLVHKAFEVNKETGKISSYYILLLFGSFLKKTDFGSDEDNAKARIKNFYETLQNYDNVLDNLDYLNHSLSFLVSVLTNLITKVIYDVGVSEKLIDSTLLEIKKLNETVFSVSNQGYYIDLYLKKFKSEENNLKLEIDESLMFEIFLKRNTILYILELRQEMISLYSLK